MDERADGPAHGIELQIIDAGELALQYRFATVAEALAILDFVKDFFPFARFVIQPLRH